MCKVDIKSLWWDIFFILDIDFFRLMNCLYIVIVYVDRNFMYGVIIW